jgi:hypothetical protein
MPKLGGDNKELTHFNIDALAKVMFFICGFASLPNTLRPIVDSNGSSKKHGIFDSSSPYADWMALNCSGS